MPLLTWKETWSVGAPDIDAQHKRLVELINELHDAMARGAANDVLSPVLDRLIEYTKYHFAHEERRLQAAGYPQLASHVREHNELTARVVRFRDDFAAGRTAISVKVLGFLKEWLTNHIVGRDKLYSPWLAPSV